MNPFNWPGPEFLLFYLVFGASVLAAQWWRKRSPEDTPSEPFDLGDPYLIAFLQGKEPALAQPRSRATKVDERGSTYSRFSTPTEPRPSGSGPPHERGSSMAGCTISFVLTKGRLTELGRKTLADAMHLYPGIPGRAAQGASRLSPREVQGASAFRGMAPQSTVPETSGGCSSS